jgi:hypothetical protein
MHPAKHRVRPMIKPSRRRRDQRRYSPAERFGSARVSRLGVALADTSPIGISVAAGALWSLTAIRATADAVPKKSAQLVRSAMKSQTASIARFGSPSGNVAS